MWYIRIYKWSGRQNNKNYPIKIGKKKKKWEWFKDPWDNIVPANICMIYIPKGEESQKYIWYIIIAILNLL